MAKENNGQSVEDTPINGAPTEDEVNGGAHGPSPEVDSRIAELEAQLAARDAEFGKLKEALDEKNALIDSQEHAFAVLRDARAAAEEKIAELSGGLTEAVSRYKERLNAAHPELLENMLTGETIQEVDASLDSALALVDRVKTNIAEKAKEVTVPAGSPERTGPDISAMSAKEKIAYAIGKESS